LRRMLVSLCGLAPRHKISKPHSSPRSPDSTLTTLRVPPLLRLCQAQSSTVFLHGSFKAPHASGKQLVAIAPSICDHPTVPRRRVKPPFGRFTPHATAPLAPSPPLARWWTPAPFPLPLAPARRSQTASRAPRTMAVGVTSRSRGGDRWPWTRADWSAPSCVRPSCPWL